MLTRKSGCGWIVVLTIPLNFVQKEFEPKNWIYLSQYFWYKFCKTTKDSGIKINSSTSNGLSSRFTIINHFMSRNTIASSSTRRRRISIWGWISFSRRVSAIITSVITTIFCNHLVHRSAYEIVGQPMPRTKQCYYEYKPTRKKSKWGLKLQFPAQWK